NPFASLKVLHARLHGKQLRELPFDPDVSLEHWQIDKLREYLHNDLDATDMLYQALEEPLSLREALSNDLGMDLRSKSDSQMGLAIIKRRVEERLGRRVDRTTIAPGTTFKYTAPDYIRFETDQ